MKKILSAISLMLVICCISFAFAACSKDEHKSIATAYAKIRNIDESEVNFTCYAEFGGVHVLMFEGIYPDALSDEIVDGVVFRHSQIKTFDVYFNGEFYSLQEAFNGGLVTHENLLTLRAIYNPQYDE